MHKWLLKIGIMLLISGCSSYKFDENLSKLNENKEISVTGQITTVTGESQRGALDARALALLNSGLGQDEAIELMLIKSPDFQSRLFDHRSRLAVAAQKGRISNPVFSFERMVKGTEIEYGKSLSFGLLNLLTLPARQDTSKNSLELGHVNLEAGDGPHGSVEMGGMFSMLKVRADVAPDDYSDPGWYKHPEGHQAYEYNGDLLELPKQLTPGKSLMAPKSQSVAAHIKAVKLARHEG